MPSILKSTKTFNNMKKENKKAKYIIEIIKANVITPDTPDAPNYTKTYIKDNIIVSFR